MKSEDIKQLFEQFEQAVCEVNGVEYWSARELQKLLGYSKWENFSNVIEKAKESCANVGQEVSNHFSDVRKTIPMPKGAEKEIDDVLLTRYACYLVAQNGDPRKRWCIDFFYPNRSNQMWEIFGEVFFGDSQRLVDA